MTKGEIKTAVLDAITATCPEVLDDYTELTQSQNVAITDAVAAALETVNPTTNYPPTGR